MKPYIAFIVTNLRLTWRDKMVVFFNYLFPLIFFFTFAQTSRAEQGGAINQVFASVVVIGVLGNGFFGGGIRAVVEREANILRRFKVAPITPAPILVSAMVVGLINFFPSVVIMFLISHFQYGMAVPENWLSLAIMIAIGTIAFRAMGQIIASVANSMAESQIIIQTLYFPMLFLSGATFPLSFLPSWVQIITQFIPATHLMSGVQNILLRQETLADNLVEIGALTLTTLLAMFISMKLFRWEKEEKLKASAKLWILAAIAPFFLIGAWQAYSKDNLTKAKEVARQLRRSRSILIKDVRVFTGEATIERASVLIRKGKIDEIFTDKVPDAKELRAEPIEAAGKTLIPGLIDAHVHLGSPGGFYDNPQDYNQKDQVERALAAYLYSGVTAVRSVGDQTDNLLRVRKVLDSGERLGAELFLCGPLFTAKGGHGTEYAKFLPENIREQFQRDFVRTPQNADEAKKMVRELKARGVNGIKAVLEAGYGGYVFERMEVPILKAVVEEAKAQGLRVVVHTGDKRDVADAIAVGADGVEHGSMRDSLPDDMLVAMKARGMSYDPTLSVMEGIVEMSRGKTDLLDRSLVQQVGPASLLAATKRVIAKRAMPGAGDWTKAEDPMRFARENLRRVYEAGVTVITGSDAGNPLVLHGPTVHRELQLWVAAGVPAQAALRGATRNAATVLGAADRIGSIKKGFEATLVLLNGNPLQTIDATEAISLVMLKGERIDRTELFNQDDK